MTQERETEPAKLLGVIPQRVVIVDDEKAVRMAMERAFLDIGVKDVQVFESGESAGRFIASGAVVDCFVLDWRLPDLGGLALLNRIQSIGIYERSPVLILSGFLDKQDFRLVAEFPLLALVEKPSHANFVFKRLGELFRERDYFDQQSAAIASEIAALQPRENFIDDRWEKLRTRLREAPRPAPVYFAAIKWLKKRFLESMAEILFQDLLLVDPDCSPALIELGRRRIAVGDYAGAKKYLKRAVEVTPRNLERLCLLGDVQLHMQEPASARESFSAAVAIDPQDQRALSGLELAENMETHLAKVDPGKLAGTLASLLNSIGVLMVHEGKIAEGVGHYKSALRYATKDNDWVKLGFNLGLAYLRWDKLADASIWFRKAWEKSRGRFQKAQDYLNQTLVEVRRLGLKPEFEHDSLLEDSLASANAEFLRNPIGDFEKSGLELDLTSERINSVASGDLKKQDADGKLPHNEFPADLYAWDKIRKLLRTVRIADAKWFKEANVGFLSQKMRAYGGLVGDRLVCVLLPKTIDVGIVPAMEEAEARAAGIVVLRCTRKSWAVMWPV